MKLDLALAKFVNSLFDLERFVNILVDFEI